jgi:Protein of unknown function (DUF2505)
MQDFTLRHEMECDEDTYWFKCVFDKEYNERLYLTDLKFPRYELKKFEDDGKIIRRTVFAQPLLPPLPGPVKKVVGDGLAYTEEGSFDRAVRRYIFKATPNALGEKARTEGNMSVEKLGDKRIARVAKIQVEVKVFMVGGLIEDQIVNSLRSSYERAAAFTNAFVKEKGY